MVKDHSDRTRGNPQPPLHGLLFSISSKDCFICITPNDRIVLAMAFVTPVVEHCSIEVRKCAVQLGGCSPVIECSSDERSF